MTRGSKALSVPSGRIGRFIRLGAMTAGVAGNMAAGAIGQLGRGNKPDLQTLLVTPRNLGRVTNELARMRGAAMKIGQLVSMDAGEFLPPEMAHIMARLRDQAHFMPPKQLEQVLNAHWPSDWRRSFSYFNVRPIAAASIGQVHRATRKDGRTVAIKVQYPGIADSIDSDIANVGTLLRMSGLLPTGMDIAPYLTDARRQLHEETDYTREALYQNKFRALLADDDRFIVPKLHDDLCTDCVLTMEFADGSAIENISDRAQQDRNRIIAAMIDLAMKEVFDIGLIQSDPNFANYRVHPDGNRIILLDFGAARELDTELLPIYRALITAGLTGAAIEPHARALNLIGGPHDDMILRSMRTVFDALNTDCFDFADMTLPNALRAQGTELAQSGYVPPDVAMDILYLQRKIGGLFLLAARTRAKLPVRDMLLERL